MNESAQAGVSAGAMGTVEQSTRAGTAPQVPPWSVSRIASRYAAGRWASACPPHRAGALVRLGELSNMHPFARIDTPWQCVQAHAVWYLASDRMCKPMIVQSANAPEVIMKSHPPTYLSILLERAFQYPSPNPTSGGSNHDAGNAVSETFGSAKRIISTRGIL
jgi:hypothetical protein